jgi:hypothetical protein
MALNAFEEVTAVPPHNGDNVHSPYDDEGNPRMEEQAQTLMPDSSEPQEKIDRARHLAIRHLLTQAD